YHGRPELTAERFVPHPLSDRPGERLYRTGDRARFRPDGALELLGRLDQQVKVRGFRIELAEVEGALLADARVREVAVLVRRGAVGDERLVAYVAFHGQEARPDAAELRGAVSQVLPPFMVPGAFVVVDALPLTPTGKVDRAALARLAPSAEESDAAAPPRTPLEEILVAAVAELLGLPRVSIHASFFELGGHSLLATRLLSRLYGSLGVELSLRRFLTEPTVAGLARQIEELRGTGGAAGKPVVAIPRAARDRPIRLSFAQERLWLIHQLQPGTAAYNSFLPLHLEGDLSIPLLGQVLQEVLRRHEALRTRLAPGDSGPVQIIDPPAVALAWHPTFVDLTALPTGPRDAEVRRLTLAEALWAFDLARGPLFRATLLGIARGDHGMLLNMHHTICDGWSLGVMTREIGALYRAFAAGRPSPLPELPIQYADYSEWQREWLATVHDEQLAYWREQLGDEPPVLDMPTDRPRPRALSDRGVITPFTVPPAVQAGLAALAAARGTTLFVVLLTAFQALLHRYSHQDRVSVGSAVANRTRVELEGLIGFFVNTLVLSLDLSGDPPFGGLVDRAREVTLGAFEHQDMPFERLVAQLQKDRDPSRQPLFQAMFVLQNNDTGSLDLPGLELSGLGAPGAGGLTQFDLVLAAGEVEGSLMGNLSSSADLFDRTTAQRLLAHFLEILAAAVADPACPLSALPLLTAAERQQVAIEWPHGRAASAAS
ncbi:MAG TPA: condensation domain-containing protein, partial [Thermoanaerobaculia bacterium]